MDIEITAKGSRERSRCKLLRHFLSSLEGQFSRPLSPKSPDVRVKADAHKQSLAIAKSEKEGQPLLTRSREGVTKNELFGCAFGLTPQRG